MFKGVWKKLLRVSLSEGKITTEDISEKLFEKYMGGSGIATKYLYDEVPPKTDPFSKKTSSSLPQDPFRELQFQAVPNGQSYLGLL